MKSNGSYVGSITTNKASGDDGILAELFQILKLLLLKVLQSVSANLEYSAVATGLEKVSFHYNLKEGKCQRLFKLPYNSVHFICEENFAQNPSS